MVRKMLLGSIINLLDGYSRGMISLDLYTFGLTYGFICSKELDTV